MIYSKSYCLRIIADREQGLSDDSKRKSEKIYNVKFPSSGWNFIQNILPVSERFYNWRDFSV